MEVAPSATSPPSASTDEIDGSTIGGPGTGITTLPLTMTTATRMGNPNAAFIWIKNTAGTNTDHGFHLLARC